MENLQQGGADEEFGRNRLATFIPPIAYMS
jgi:hypothetical protein